MRVLTDAVVVDEQGGFKASGGCVDQVFVVRHVIEVIEKGENVHVNKMVAAN